MNASPLSLLEIFLATDIPYKKLHPKQTQDIAKAMARNDAKRLEDVLNRIGGLDESVFQAVLNPEDSPRSLIADKQTSPGLFARSLARSPDQIFDWLVASIATENEWCWTRAIAFGATRDPRATQKIFEAYHRVGSDNSLRKMVLWIDHFRDGDRHEQGQAQSAKWSAQRAAVDELCEKFLAELGAQRLLDLRETLSGKPWTKPKPGGAIERTLVGLERQELAASAVPTLPSEKEPPPAPRRHAL